MRKRRVLMDDRFFKLKITNPQLPAARKYCWVGIKYDHFTNSNSYRFYITEERRAYKFEKEDLEDPILKSWLDENNYTYQQVFISSVT